MARGEISTGGQEMPSHNIDVMVWNALTDEGFRKGLLNGHRSELAIQLGLTAAEHQAVMAVQADTLEAFAGALCQQTYCVA
jgi:hypothetical protein